MDAISAAVEAAARAICASVGNTPWGWDDESSLVQERCCRMARAAGSALLRALADASQENDEWSDHRAFSEAATAIDRAALSGEGK